MARRPKAESNFITPVKKPRDSEGNLLSDKAFGMINGTILLSLHNIYQQVKEKKVILNVREVAVLSDLRKEVDQTELENSRDFFKDCNSCIFKTNCNLYESDKNCTYDLTRDIKKPEDALDVMQKLLVIQGDRMMRGLLVEKLEGGVVDRDVSEEMMMYFEMVGKMKEVMDESESLTLKVKGKGIISKLFGGMIEKNEKEFDITPKKREVAGIPVDNGKDKSM